MISSSSNWASERWRPVANPRARYRVEFKPSAARALTKLDRETQRRIIQKAEALAVDPRPQGVEKLAGEQDAYRVRSGDYRIIYEIRDDILLVMVLKVGHRRDIYRGI